MLVLRFSGALSLRKVGVNLSLAPQIKRERAIHLFEGQCRVSLDHLVVSGSDPAARRTPSAPCFPQSSWREGFSLANRPEHEPRLAYLHGASSHRLFRSALPHRT